MHHLTVLKAELSRSFDLRKVMCRPSPGAPELVQLGDQKGMIFRQAPEDEAMLRWAEGDFLTIERQFAKQWRNGLTSIDFRPTKETEWRDDPRHSVQFIEVDRNVKLEGSTGEVPGDRSCC